MPDAFDNLRRDYRAGPGAGAPGRGSPSGRSPSTPAEADRFMDRAAEFGMGGAARPGTIRPPRAGPGQAYDVSAQTGVNPAGRATGPPRPGPAIPRVTGTRGYPMRPGVPGRGTGQAGGGQALDEALNLQPPPPDMEAMRRMHGPLEPTSPAAAPAQEGPLPRLQFGTPEAEAAAQQMRSQLHPVGATQAPGTPLPRLQPHTLEAEIAASRVAEGGLLPSSRLGSGGAAAFLGDETGALSPRAVGGVGLGPRLGLGMLAHPEALPSAIRPLARDPLGTLAGLPGQAVGAGMDLLRRGTLEDYLNLLVPYRDALQGGTNLGNAAVGLARDPNDFAARAARYAAGVGHAFSGY